MDLSNFILDIEVCKYIFLIFIFFVSLAFQMVLFMSMFIHRKKENFLSVIKRNGRYSKAGIFFFVLMIVIIYQALFLDNLTPGLVELLGLIIAGDLGATWMGNRKEVAIAKIESEECDSENLSSWDEEKVNIKKKDSGC